MLIYYLFFSFLFFSFCCIIIWEESVLTLKELASFSIRVVKICLGLINCDDKLL